MPTPFPVGPVNIFLVKGDPPILIDAGTRIEAGYDKLVMSLKENGLSLRDIGIVLLTHGHLDHIGWLDRILAESNAKAYAHPYVVRQYADYDTGVEQNIQFLAGIMPRFGVPADLAEEIISQRENFRALAAPVHIHHALADCDAVAGLIAVFVPGHSASDTLFFDPVRRAAFTGDHVIRNMSPNPLLRRPAEGEGRPQSLVEYQESLRRTRALDIETCYPGHGHPFGGHHAVIDNLLERHERRTREVQAILAQGPLTPYQLARHLFPRITPPMLHLGLSVAIGHLDVLQNRGQAVADEREGVLYYISNEVI